MLQQASTTSIHINTPAPQNLNRCQRLNTFPPQQFFCRTLCGLPCSSMSVFFYVPVLSALWKFLMSLIPVLRKEKPHWASSIIWSRFKPKRKMLKSPWPLAAGSILEIVGKAGWCLQRPLEILATVTGCLAHHSDEQRLWNGFWNFESLGRWYAHGR